MGDNYTIMRKHCSKNSKISERVNDNFLMQFIADRKNMNQKVREYSKKYQHIIRQMPGDFFSRVMAAYIVGKTLTSGGWLNQYMNHVRIQELDQEASEFLAYQIAHPWRYCFAVIVDRKEEDFFVMRDVFVDDELLIYSNGIKSLCAENHQNSLYFFLTGYNGQCWQTYGPIIPMRSFSVDDIFNYGFEVFPEVDTDESLMESVYKDSIPYYMLACGMEYPIVMHGDQELRHWLAEDEVDAIDTGALASVVKTQYNRDTYRFSHHQWSAHPHFAVGYYQEKKGVLFRQAMTYEGFFEFSKILIKAGIDIDPDPDNSIGLSIVKTMEDILKKKIDISPLEKYFPEKEEDTESKEIVDGLNRFMGLLLPYINSGKTPDISALAKQAGINTQEAQSLYDQIKNKFPR